MADAAMQETTGLEPASGADIGLAPENVEVTKRELPIEKSDREEIPLIDLLEIPSRCFFIAMTFMFRIDESLVHLRLSHLYLP